MRTRATRLALRTAQAAAIAFVCLMVVFPFVWMLSTAFKRNSEILVYPPVLIPKTLTLDHFREIFSPDGEWVFFRNSIVATAISTILTIGLAAPAAYALGRHRFPRDAGRHVSVGFLLLRFLPPFAIIIPIFSMARTAGLLDNVWALIIIYTAFHLPLAIWIVEPAVRQIPADISDAAQVDGASPVQTLTLVMLPLLRPSIATAAAFCTVFSWNEFFFALILTSERARTYPVLINSFVTEMGPEWGLIAATALLAAIPVVVFCLFMQKNLIRGLTSGSVR